MEHSTIQMVVSSAIFIIAYILIIWDKFDRAVVALSGASLMILFKILSQEDAFKEIDFNTIRSFNKYDGYRNDYKKVGSF